MSESKQILVVDVPAASTAEEAERLLNAVCERGYYVLAILPGERGGAHAYFNRRRPIPIAPPRGNRDGKADAAIDIIKANPDKSLSQTVELLKAAGIKRGINWVSTKRRELFAKAIDSH